MGDMGYDAAADRYDDSAGMDYRFSGRSGLSCPRRLHGELAEIDRYAGEAGVNLWAKQTQE